MKRFLLTTALMLAFPSANAQNMLSDGERAAIQKSREFCIELVGGRERLNRRIFFGGDSTANLIHTQVDECAMRELPRYMPPASPLMIGDVAEFTASPSRCGGASTGLDSAASIQEAQHARQCSEPDQGNH
jgi:hypothetical protein